MEYTVVDTAMPLLSVIVAIIAVTVFGLTSLLALVALTCKLFLKKPKIPDNWLKVLVVKVILESVAAALSLFYHSQQLQQIREVNRKVPSLEEQQGKYVVRSFEANYDLLPKAQALSEQAKNLLNTGKQNWPYDPARAEQLLLEAVEIQPDNYELRGNLGIIQTGLGKYREAITNLERAKVLFHALPPELQNPNRYIILNSTLIGAYGRINAKSKFSEVEKDTNILDFEDTIIRFYLNLGSAYMDAHEWAAARKYAEKALSLARTFDIPDLKIKSIANLGSVLFRIDGDEVSDIQLIDKGLDLLKTYTLPEEKKAEASQDKANLLNSRGLLYEDIAQKGGAQAQEARTTAIDSYTSAINELKPLVVRRSDARSLLASLYGNRADSYERAGDSQAAITDRREAIDYFIACSDKSGISTQLTAIAKRVLSERESEADLMAGFAGVVASSQLGKHKPPTDIQEDQQLELAYQHILTQAQQREVRLHLEQYLEHLTDIGRGRWETIIGE